MMQGSRSADGNKDWPILRDFRYPPWCLGNRGLLVVLAFHIR